MDNTTNDTKKIIKKFTWRPNRYTVGLVISFISILGFLGFAIYLASLNSKGNSSDTVPSATHGIDTFQTNIFGAKVTPVEEKIPDSITPTSKPTPTVVTSPTPTPQPTSSPTSAPTSAPAPTAAPTTVPAPTNTPTPTPTITPTEPTPTP